MIEASLRFKLLKSSTSVEVTFDDMDKITKNDPNWSSLIGENPRITLMPNLIHNSSKVKNY